MGIADRRANASESTVENHNIPSSHKIENCFVVTEDNNPTYLNEACMWDETSNIIHNPECSSITPVEAVCSNQHENQPAVDSRYSIVSDLQKIHSAISSSTGIEARRHGYKTARFSKEKGITNAKLSHFYSTTLGFQAFIDRLSQQNLDGYNFSNRMYSVSYFSISMTVAGILCLVAGVAILFASRRIWFKEYKYDDSTALHTFNITLERDLNTPLFVYYKLFSFYGNYRTYTVDGPENLNLSLKCGKIVNFTDAKAYRTFNNLLTLPEILIVPSTQTYLYPCGLSALAVFNDNFGIYYTYEGVTEEIPIESHFIYNPYDFTLFAKPLKSYSGQNKIAWKNPADLSFRIWLKQPLCPEFVKQYGIINKKLQKKGVLTILIDSKWPSTAWKSEKAIFITTLSGFGSQQFFLAYFLIATGALSILLVFCVFIMKYVGLRLTSATARGVYWNDIIRIAQLYAKTQNEKSKESKEIHKEHKIIKIETCQTNRSNTSSRNKNSIIRSNVSMNIIALATPSELAFNDVPVFSRSEFNEGRNVTACFSPAVNSRPSDIDMVYTCSDISVDSSF